MVARYRIVASLTLKQFTADAPVAACKALASCSNEEVTVVLDAMLMMIAGFATLEDPTAGKHLEGIGDAMKKDGRSTMNGDECRKIMGVVTKATGFDADTIQAAIDAKKTEFNGDKAAACYAALSTHEATSTRAASAIPSPMPLHASYVRPGRASTVSSWRAKSPQT